MKIDLKIGFLLAVTLLMIGCGTLIKSSTLNTYVKKIRSIVCAMPPSVRSSAKEEAAALGVSIKVDCHDLRTRTPEQ